MRVQSHLDMGTIQRGNLFPLGHWNKKTMNETDEQLIRILAQTDAIFRPMRAADWTPPAPSNIWEARQRFSEGGVTSSTGGGGEARRKASQRTVDELASTGLLVLCGDKRRVGVRLTEAGEVGVRSLCGLPGLDESHRVLRQIIELSAKADDGQSLCREFWLWGVSNYSGDTKADANEAWEISLLLASSLCRGWIESSSDIHGRACYSATKAGRAAAKQPAPSLPRELPEWSEPAGRKYHDETIAARQRLRSASPTTPGEIGQCPLSASLDLRQPRRRKEKADE